MFRGKKYQESAKLIDKAALYDTAEAMELVVNMYFLKAVRAKSELHFGNRSMECFFRCLFLCRSMVRQIAEIPVR